MCLDKDILYKGNKIYGPDTCIFVPQRINTIFGTNMRRRGNLPIGVTFCKRNKKYTSHCWTLNADGKRNNIALGYFDSPEKAFNAYKQFKESYIQKVAENYKPFIPETLYNALINYKININD